MEKGAGDDSARGVGMCDRFLTFLANNLSMIRQKSITEGPRNGSSNISNNHAEEQKEEDDEFVIQIEKVEFEFSDEEDHKSVTATILEERNTDVSTARASDQQQEEAADHQVDAEATAAMVQEKKVRKSVTIKDDREEAGDKDAAAAAAAAKKSLFKKRRASSSDQLGAEGEDPKLPRRSLRLRMPAIMRVPSNIDEQSATFIDERKRGFGRRKSEK